MFVLQNNAIRDFWQKFNLDKELGFLLTGFPTFSGNLAVPGSHARCEVKITRNSFPNTLLLLLFSLVP